MPRFSVLRLRTLGIIYLMASWRPPGGGERPLIMLTASRKGHITSSLIRAGHGPRTKRWR